MVRRRMQVAVVMLVAIAGLAASADAQVLGTFRWQLRPYCNMLDLTVTQVGGTYRLEGTDNQCGAATVAPVIGVAALNPDGTIGIGLNVVTTPGGVPLHVDAAITLPSISGTWRDSAGNTGPFTFTAGPGVAGGLRPAARIGAAVVDPSQVQLRVGGSCAPGEAVRTVNQDGSVVCQAVGSTAADITGVSAGTGLTGGAASGEVTIGVLFGGTGGAATVARSDHTHESAVPGSVGVGPGALAQHTTGCCNTAVGAEALVLNTTRQQNTAVGYQALAQSSADFNTAVGTATLVSTTTGGANTAVGAQALYANQTGSSNVALGDSVLRTIVGSSNNVGVGRHAGMSLGSGNSNTFIGAFAGINVGVGGGNLMAGTSAGFQLTNGVNNIYLGSPGGASVESNTIRIGQSSVQTAAFVAGVSGVNVTGAGVFVNASGQLGVAASSRRFKQDITTIGHAREVVQGLRPVQFLYKPEFDDGSRVLQYGLIAEEAAEIDPGLVITENGQAQTVRYHFLPPLLVAEVQRLERARAEQAQEIQELRRQLDQLRAVLASTVPR